MVSKNKSIGDRISSGIGVVKPYDVGAMLMKPIFDLSKDANKGKLDSPLEKGVNFIAKQNNKVSFLPKAGTDPKTDIGKRTGDFISNKLKQIPSNLKNFRKNMNVSTM